MVYPASKADFILALSLATQGLSFRKIDGAFFNLGWPRAYVWKDGKIKNSFLSCFAFCFNFWPPNA